MKKLPKCTICDGPHYKSFCFQAPEKPIITRKPLEASRKPIKSKTSIGSSKPRKPLKRSKIAPQSKSERAKLTREADRVFSIYIRRRGSVDGFNSCFTCGVRMPWRELQNGHYISRRKMAVRYDPDNCKPQCGTCNSELSGNLKIYRERLGEVVARSLQDKVNSDTKFTEADLKLVIDKYKSK